MIKYTKKEFEEKTEYFANLIKTERERRGLTRVELSLALGLSHSVVDNYERKRCPPSQNTIQKLIALGFPIDPKYVAGTVEGIKGKMIKIPEWENTFDRRFTLAYMPGKAQSYDGDDWKMTEGVPVKPSVVKAFFREIIATIVNPEEKEEDETEQTEKNG